MTDVQALVLAPPQPAPAAARGGKFSAYFGTPGNTLISLASIAAIRPPLGDVFLAAETDTSVTAVAGLHINFGIVDKHQRISDHSCPRP